MKTISEILHKVVEQNDLNSDESYSFFLSVMKGEVDPAILAGFLTALKIKGESRFEILGAVRAMKESAIQPKLKKDFSFLDTCGTGGDGKSSVNISTLSALTLSAIGIKVAKHGNRSVSSLCGSSDLLSELGYPLEISTDDAEKRIIDKNFTFLFAPHWHPAMKYAVPVRKALGFRTLFNILGPLSNPFTPEYQVLGVFSKSIMEDMSYVLGNVGVKSTIVCHSRDGYDEFSIFEPTDYIFSKNGNSKEEMFDPDLLNLPKFLPSDLTCSSKEDAIKKAKQVLEGEKFASTYAVALNAGVALYLIGEQPDILKGFEFALEKILEGVVGSYFKSLIN